MNIISEYWSIIVAVVGIAIAWGSMQVELKLKTKQFESEIKELKVKQDSTEAILSDIKETLSELNLKVGLLVNGQLRIKEQD